MRVTAKQTGSSVAKVYNVYVPKPVRLADYTTELTIATPDGTVTISLTPREVDYLIRFMQPPRL